MYLEKSPYGVFYTRIALPIQNQRQGLPACIRISLKTKDRSQAKILNARVAAEILGLIHDAGAAIAQADLAAVLERVRAEILVKPCIRQESSQAAPQEPKKRSPPLRSSKRSATKAKRAAPKIQRAVKEFLASKSRESLSKRYLHQLSTRLQFFVSFMEDSERPLGRLSSRDAMAYRSRLRGQGWASKTANEYFSVAKQFINWCVLMQYVRTRIFEGVKLGLVDSRAEHEERLAWSGKDLQKLFAHKRFNEAELRTDVIDYWLPLILVFSGLRSAELLQLHVDDVIQCDETGVWFFDINDGYPGKRLKTPSARRQVPIHSSLIKMGLLLYSYGRKQEGKETLFDVRRCGKFDDFSGSPTDRFNRFMQREFDYREGERPTAHGFRHTFVTELKNQGVEEHSVAELVGHAHPMITYSRYGKPSSLLKMQDIVEKIVFPLPGVLPWQHK